jgi:hypothetical protein
MGFRECCLDELLRHDGHGDFFGLELCISCKTINGVYKCLDCFSGGLLRCRGCLVEAHRDHPLHRIEVSSFTTYLSAALLMHHSIGTAIFLRKSPLKAWGFVYSSVMVVAHVLTHRVDPRTSAFSISLESTVFPLITATVERMMSFILVPNSCAHAGSQRLSTLPRPLLPSTVSTCFTYSPFKGKCLSTTSTTPFFT